MNSFMTSVVMDIWYIMYLLSLSFSIERNQIKETIGMPLILGGLIYDHVDREFSLYVNYILQWNSINDALTP